IERYAPAVPSAGHQSRNDRRDQRRTRSGDDSGLRTPPRKKRGMTRGSALAAVVETVDLTKRFRDHLAVDRVTLGIGQGESWAILGPNGSGKTTLLGMLLGVIRPTSGRIQLFGEYDGVRDHRARLRI